MQQVCVDPPRIAALTLPARCSALAPAVDIARYLAPAPWLWQTCCYRSTGQTDIQTDTRPLYRPCTVEAGSVNNLQTVIAYTKGDVTSRDLWPRYDRHFVGMKCRNEWGYGGEDLSCYSNKIHSVCLRKCPYNHYATDKHI